MEDELLICELLEEATFWKGTVIRKPNFLQGSFLGIFSVEIMSRKL
jgi:hypothetical protein